MKFTVQAIYLTVCWYTSGFWYCHPMEQYTKKYSMYPKSNLVDCREVRKQLKASSQRSAARRPTKSVIVLPKTLGKLAALSRPVKTVNPEPIVIDD